MRIARALDEVHRRTEGLDGVDRPGDDGRAGDLPGPPLRAPPRYPRPRGDPERLGVCVDTCHIFAAGYSLATAEEYDETIDRLDRAVGLDRVRVWHLNDSCRELRQPRRSPRGDRGRADGPGAVPSPGQRSPVPRLADDPGDAQGDRRRRGPRRPQPEDPPAARSTARRSRSSGRSRSALIAIRGLDASGDRRERDRGEACGHVDDSTQWSAGRRRGHRRPPAPLDPSWFINRELSWLDFNERVLEEARDPSNPLLERLRFLAICASNLDEFFEVRVAGLQAQLYDNLEPQDPPPDGMGPLAQLIEIARRAHDFVARQYEIWFTELRPELLKHGIRVCDPDELTRVAERVPRRVLRHPGLPGPHAAGDRPGAPVPAPAQQEPEPDPADRVRSSRTPGSSTRCSRSPRCSTGWSRSPTRPTASAGSSCSKT